MYLIFYDNILEEKVMEQASNNTENNMAYKVIEEEVQQEEVVNHIENTTNSENHE